MMNRILLILLFPLFLNAQGYVSYFTGNTTNIETTPEFGVCMMGGATEHDEAMKWLLQKANGGDVVVLRSSGSSGYNNYLYSELGINVNSVETLVITSVEGATNPYVLDKVANAEMIWFAGGNQANYVNFFKDNALEDLLNEHINVKNAPIGGTSAGMAILGSHYFSAVNGSVSTSEALTNPYNVYMIIGSNDFLEIPYLENVITDSHYDSPDRRGRHTAFLARMAKDENIRSFGIAANEYVAVCIDATGKARVFGEYPQYQEFAYFLQANCQDDYLPEACVAGTPLTWNRGGEAVKVYKVPGLMTGDYYFDLSDWISGEGGSWEHWSANSGVMSFVPGTAPDCDLSNQEFETNLTAVYPNPFQDFIRIDIQNEAGVKLYDFQGKLVLEQKFSESGFIETSKLSSGFYILKIDSGNKSEIQKLIKY